MTYKTLLAACVAVVTIAGTGPGQAQVPAISTAWDPTDLPLERCLERSRSILEKLKGTHVESSRRETFADFKDIQVAVHCLPERRMYYIYGAGPADSIKRVQDVLRSIKIEFSR